MQDYATNPPFDPKLGLKNETCVAVYLPDALANSNHRYAYTIFVNKPTNPQPTEDLTDPYAW